MSNQRYNGWTNYATWRVNLELVDDMSEHWQEVIEENFTDDGGYIKNEDDCLYELSNYIEDHVEEVLFAHVEDQTFPYGIIESYARAFMSDVNWYSIAKHQVQSYNLEKEYQDTHE